MTAAQHFSDRRHADAGGDDGRRQFAAADECADAGADVDANASAGLVAAAAAFANVHGAATVVACRVELAEIYWQTAVRRCQNNANHLTSDHQRYRQQPVQADVVQSFEVDDLVASPSYATAVAASHAAVRCLCFLLALVVASASVKWCSSVDLLV